MPDAKIDDAPRDGADGRILSHADARDVPLVEDVTRHHPASGLVIRGRDAVTAIARLRATSKTRLLVLDVAAWSNTTASEATPLSLPQEGGLFSVGLDEWATGILKQGASAVFTPSRFVRCADWSALRATLRAGRSSTVAELRTLVAIDAAVLQPQHLTTFLETLTADAGGRPLAFAFADKREPLAKRERLAGLRTLLARFPGSWVIASDVLVGTDVVTRGGTAAIGLTGSLRRPTRPHDTSGPPAAGWIPGMFLRQLWETRSPATYAEWYANSSAPTCDECDGRAADRFSNHLLDKQQVLRHNVHAWLRVLSEIRRQPAPRSWLAAERLRGLRAHAGIRPARGPLQADTLLRALCELDDPQQRKTTPTGSWC